MGIEVRFTQALGMEQYIEPAASAVTLVVGNFNVFKARGIDILFHGTEIEQHGGLQVIEKHAVPCVQFVIPFRWDYECGTVGIGKKSFLGRTYLLFFLGPDEYKCIYNQQ